MIKMQLVCLILASMVALSLAGTFDYYDLNRAVFDAQNKARTNPAYFGQLAQDEIENKFVYDRDGNPTSTICLAEDFVPKSNKCYFTMGTQEGVSAWKEAASVLSSSAAKLPALQWSEGLAQACYDHINDQGPSGQNGHTGSDGSSPFDRIDKYVKSTASGENLAYSDSVTGTDMVLQLLIDDGVPNRGHRTNIVSTDFTHGGVSCGCHTVYTEMCCFAYGRDVKEIDSSATASIAPQLKECAKYNINTRGDKSDSFDVGNTANVAKPQSSPAQPAEPALKRGNPIKPASDHTTLSKDDLGDMFPGVHEHFGDNVGHNDWGMGNEDMGLDWTFSAEDMSNDWGYGAESWGDDYGLSDSDWGNADWSDEDW
jgi:uncharacterized protein YkwD